MSPPCPTGRALVMRKAMQKHAGILFASTPNLRHHYHLLHFILSLPLDPLAFVVARNLLCNFPLLGMSSSSLDSGSTCSVGGAARELQGRCYRICMVSDCFYPDAGGVENHMITLAQCLILQGHKVIVVTRSRGDRVGVRWMTNGLKVYYAPLLCMPDVFSSGRVVLPTLFASAPLLRSIWIREQIEIVHGHQAFSVLCHEALLHARTMGLKTCFTDHSLFGFSDASSIHMNKVQTSLSRPPTC